MNIYRKHINKYIHLLCNHPKDTPRVIQDIVSLQPRDFVSQLKALSLSRIFSGVMEAMIVYFVEKWVRLYKGASADITNKVVKEIFVLCPGFQRHLKKEGISFPANPPLIAEDDLSEYGKWLNDNSTKGKSADSIKWLASIIFILPTEALLAVRQDDLLFGQEFIPLLKWGEMVSEIFFNISRDKYPSSLEISKQSAAKESFLEFFRHNEGRIVLSIDNAPTPPVKVPREAREQMEHYGYKFATPIDIPGTTNDRMDTLVRVGNQDVYLSDAYFPIFLALIISLLKKPRGNVSKVTLMETCGKAGSNPNTFIEKVRDKFRNVLGSKDPQAYLKFIERDEKGSVRISVPPALVSVNKNRLLESHHDLTVRKIAESLPDNVKYRK